MPLAKKKKLKYTYADYLEWPEDVRCEIINGKLFNMTPAPSRIHQKLSRNILIQFGNFLKNKKCEVYSAPFDVRLPDTNKKDEFIETVVQPDIVVICDKKKLDERGCIGAPDLIIEITSPASASKDMKEKFQLYEKHGVKEYWIVHPEEKIVMVFKSGKNKEYSKPEVYSNDEKINAGVIKGLEIDLGSVFEQ